jgi:hypothetical protein
MSRTRTTKLVRHGEYAAEIDVELIDDNEGWAPYLSPQDVYRLDDVQDALRAGDLGRAAKLARVYRLRPVEAAG